MPENDRFYNRILVIACLFSLAVGGCASVPQSDEEESITVTGEVTVRGQQPSSEYVLLSEGGTVYVLDFPNETDITFSTPTRLQISGRVYTDVWQGRPYAHIEVGEWERAR